MDWKKIGKKLLFPPVWVIVMLTVISAVALIVVFTKGLENHVIAYVTYPISAYAVTVLTVFFILTFPGWYKDLKQRFYNHPYGYKYMTDRGYRVRVSLYISLMVNLFYSVFKLISGIVLASFWWGAVAVYYIILSVVRFLLLRYMRDNRGEPMMLFEYRRYRLCGILMLILNVTLTGIVFQMVWQNKGYAYPGTMIFAAAAYTFYMVTSSIISMVKYRKYKSPVMSASKAIKFAAALVSLLSLETAMLAQFGDDPVFTRIMTACTGAGVCMIVLAMSIYMIVKSTIEIKKLQINNS